MQSAEAYVAPKYRVFDRDCSAGCPVRGRGVSLSQFKSALALLGPEDGFRPIESVTESGEETREFPNGLSPLTYTDDTMRY